jgi:hypothetical protein
LFEAEIAFRLGEIHIYLKNHQIQTSEFQSFCDRWIVFSPRRNDDFLKKTVFHDLTFRSAGMFMLLMLYQLLESAFEARLLGVLQARHRGLLLAHGCHVHQELLLALRQLLWCSTEIQKCGKIGEDLDLWKTLGKTYRKTDCETQSVDVLSCPNSRVDPNFLDKQKCHLRGSQPQFQSDVELNSKLSSEVPKLQNA